MIAQWYEFTCSEWRHVLSVLMKIGVVPLDLLEGRDAPLEKDPCNIEADPLVRVGLWQNRSGQEEMLTEGAGEVGLSSAHDPPP